MCSTRSTPTAPSQMLREHSQPNGRKLVDVAQAVVDSQLLQLTPPPEARPEPVAVEPPGGVLGSTAWLEPLGGPLPFNRTRADDAPHRAADTWRRQSERTAARSASSRAVATQIVVSAAP